MLSFPKKYIPRSSAGDSLRSFQTPPSGKQKGDKDEEGEEEGVMTDLEEPDAQAGEEEEKRGRSTEEQGGGTGRRIMC